MKEKMNNEQIKDLRKEYIYPNQNHYYAEPIQPVRAKGSRVWEYDGTEYLDIIGGIVTISVGHNHPRIVKAMQKMLDNDAIQHTTPLYLSSQVTQLAKKVADRSPGHLDKCYFTNSGSESNELAIMNARVATGESTVIALRHGYHGGTGVPIALCGHASWKFPHQPSSSVIHAAAPYCYRCPFGKEKNSCSLECAEDMKNIIETSTCGKIAAVIVEPILGVGGFIDPPVEYHKRVSEIVRSFGGLYISDEVQTGVGRLGKHFWAIEESGVVPDMITSAKGLGNGAPIGAIIARNKIADALKGKLHFNTFGGDPYQTMQAAETLDIIADENLIANAGQMGAYLKEGFEELQKDFPVIGDVRGRGLMLGLELVKDRSTKEPASAETALLMERTKENQLLIGKGGLWGSVVRIAPVLNTSREECDEILTKLRRSLESL